jgi:hypothetical protein
MNPAEIIQTIGIGIITVVYLLEKILRKDLNKDGHIGRPRKK